MAALEEFELGIDHIRNAFKRADNGFTNAYKMLEAQQQKNHKLEAENAKLREQVTQLRDDWESERDYADQMEAKEKSAVAENAKLRELMYIMHSEMVSCEDNGYICGGHKFDKRVRELRVEVDG